MLRNPHKIALTVSSASTALALAIIAWTALQEARAASKSFGENSPATVSQKARLDPLTDEMEGGE